MGRGWDDRLKIGNSKQYSLLKLISIEQPIKKEHTQGTLFEYKQSLEYLASIFMIISF